MMAKKTTVVLEEEDDAKSISSVSTVSTVKSKEIHTDDDETKGSNVFSNVVRWLSDSMMGSKERAHYEQLIKALQNSTMFRYCSDANRQKLASRMVPIKFKKGDVLQIQGEAQKTAFVIVEGTVVRKRLVDDQLHTVGPLGYAGSQNSVGMLHLLQREPSHSTVSALSDGYAFALDADVFQELLEEDPGVSHQVIQSLIVELRDQTYSERTPLFLQKGKSVKGDPLNFFAVSIAASVESFYRSSLNAILIRQLTGKPAAFFPNMHIQLPSRILYINGFKGLRYVLENKIDPRDYAYPQLMGLSLALIPGIVMTPVSSVLEAQSVTHMNNEPLMVRWTRGLVPRTVREIVFGVGINQLSDFFEERFDNVFSSSIARNFAGSLMAGAVAGYLSHVPHNLSTLKLADPKQNYANLFTKLKTPWDNWWGKTISAENTAWRRAAVPALTIMFPQGVFVRTAQISGSFLIINSTINALKHINVRVTMDPTKGVV